jgi:hypothetical protein
MTERSSTKLTIPEEEGGRGSRAEVLVAEPTSISGSQTRPTAPAGPRRATGNTGERASMRLAWVTLALSLGLLICSWLLSWLPTDPSGDARDSFGLVATIAVVALALVGALITVRRPQNRIGWIFCASALLWAVGGAADAYAAYGVRSQEVSLPGEQVMAWLGSGPGRHRSGCW